MSITILSNNSNCVILRTLGLCSNNRGSHQNKCSNRWICQIKISLMDLWATRMAHRRYSSIRKMSKVQVRLKINKNINLNNKNIQTDNHLYKQIWVYQIGKKKLRRPPKGKDRVRRTQRQEVKMHNRIGHKVEEIPSNQRRVSRRNFLFARRIMITRMSQKMLRPRLRDWMPLMRFNNYCKTRK